MTFLGSFLAPLCKSFTLFDSRRVIRDHLKMSMMPNHAQHQGHHHHHHHHHGHAVKNMKLAFFLNLFFAIFELIGGLWANSFAILSSALHDLGDAATIGISLTLEKRSQKKRDQNFTYGYRRWSLVASLLMSAILAFGSLLVGIEAIQHLFSSQAKPPESEKMFLIAVIGILVNGASFLRLSKGDSQHERIMSLHMLEDLLGWASVFVGAVLIYFFNLDWIDPAISLFLAAFVLYGVYRNLKSQLDLVLQKIPEEFDTDLFFKSVRSLPGVLDFHDFHVWSMDGHNHVMSLHLRVEKIELSEKIKNEVRQIANKMGHYHLTIEIESQGEVCADKC